MTSITCPDLDALAGVLSDGLEHHLRDCAACRAARELCAQRAAASDRAEACERAEILLAMRDDGVLGDRERELLDAHLATCPRCAGFGDAPSTAIAPTLPTIDPTAYSLGPEIARGGMGRIRAAHDRRIGRPVVVKELITASPALTARFEREARVTARLQHPGIVPIYEIGAWPDGTPFYVMRRVVGRTLGEALAAAPSLSARLALLPALITAAEAVAFAHHQGVVHRDLTPANIVVGDYGETIVIDWGLAKQLDDDRPDRIERADASDPVAPPHAVDPAVTRAGDVLGTAAYMPPEQAAGAEVDPRADVYALGALLHHLLAGTPPYLGSPDEILAQLRDGAPPATSTDLLRAAPDLVSITRKAMARNPIDRYPDAGALVAELRRFTAGQVVAAHRYSFGESVRLWMRRHVVLTTTLIAGLIAGAVGVFGILRERDAALAERRRTDQLLGTVRADDAVRNIAAGHTWVAALELVDALRLGADTPGVRRELAELMRGIDAITVHTPHRPLRYYDGGATEYPAITGAAFSPDGQQLVVSTYDGFDIYATDDGHHLVSGLRPAHWIDPIEALKGNRAAGRVRYTPDGRFLVDEEADLGRWAAVWEASTGKLVVARTAPAGREFTATRSGDGMLAELEPTHSNAQVEALDLAHGTVVRSSHDAMTLVAPHDLAPSCAGSPGFTGDLAAAVQAGRCGRSLDGRMIATLAHGEIVIWDAATEQRRQTIPAAGNTEDPVFVDHDRRLLVRYPSRAWSSDRATAGGQVELRDVATGELVEEFVGNVVALSADRSRIAIQPARRGVVVVPLDRDPALARFDRAGHGLARTLAVDERGATVLGEMADGSLRAFDAIHDRAWPLPPLRAPAAMSRDGARLLASRADGALVVVQVSTGAVIRTITASNDVPVRALALDRSGELALVVHRDDSATRTEVSTGETTRLRDIGVASTIDTLVLGCHRTGGRARYDLETKAEDEADPTPPDCATTPDDVDLAPRETTSTSIGNGKKRMKVEVDGSTIYLRSSHRDFVLTAPAPPARVVGTGDLIATGTATWTTLGVELQPRRHLAAAEREVWLTPDHERLVVIDAEGNMSLWDLHLETRSAEELAAQLRSRLGLEVEDGEIYGDETEEEQEEWQRATRSGVTTHDTGLP